MPEPEVPKASSALSTRNIDCNLLKILRPIGGSGSIGGAARAVGKQQSSAAVALQRLETFAGDPPCERTIVHAHASMMPAAGGASA